MADIEQRKSNEMIGAELGYRYVDLPIICNVPGGPEHLFREYHPTTWPGARLPHVWLDDGTPMQDHIPDGYTILKLGRTKADASGLENAIRARGAPVTVLDVPDRVAREIYGYRPYSAAARSCMWCGAATLRRKMRPKSRRSRPGTSLNARDVIGFEPNYAWIAASAMPPSAPTTTTRSGGAFQAVNSTKPISATPKSPGVLTELVQTGE